MPGPDAGPPMDGVYLGGRGRGNLSWSVGGWRDWTGIDVQAGKGERGLLKWLTCGGSKQVVWFWVIP